jgi:preprotein translocase subunit YajC
MSRKNLLACILTISLLALAAPLPAEAPGPSTTRPSTGRTELRQTPMTRPAATTSDASGSTTRGDANQPPPQAPRPWSPWDIFSGSNGFILLMVGMIVLMLVMSSRNRRRQQKKQSGMLAAMKKGDRVTTIGGLIGTLIEVRENEVVIKVDEQNNTRMRFLRSAIHHVGDAASAAAAEKEKGK